MIDVTAPSSKSLSHRYLIAAALADGSSTLSNVLESDDTLRTKTILAGAGAHFSEGKAGSGDGQSFTVSGVGGRLVGGTRESPLDCFVNESGTTCRILTAVLCTGIGTFRVLGAPRLEQRPLGELVSALRKLRFDIRYEREEGHAPLRITTKGFPPEAVPSVFSMPEHALPVSMDESSQYFSGLLLASPMANGILQIILSGKKAVSWPYIGLTLSCMRDFGIHFLVETRKSTDPAEMWEATDWHTLTHVEPGCLRIKVQPGRYRAGHFHVEGDWSGASYFVAAGALGREPVRIHGLRTDSLQGDRAIADIIGRMGARIEGDRLNNSVVIHPAPLKGIEVDMGQCPDLVPTVACAAAFADGDTVISNVAHLRMKESDRLKAQVEGLGKIGVAVEEREDGLVIHGLGHDARISVGSTMFEASNDHRMVMSQALFSLRADDVAPAMMEARFDTPDVVKKSFPRFWEVWRAFGNVQ